jgi:Bacterial regulatory helix-turn-helix protein, lysR family
MDRFDAMRAFIRIVERRSFTLTAQDIGLPRSTITQTIKQLEARLGVRYPCFTPQPATVATRTNFHRLGSG